MNCGAFLVCVEDEKVGWNIFHESLWKIKGGVNVVTILLKDNFVL